MQFVEEVGLAEIMQPGCWVTLLQVLFSCCWGAFSRTLYFYLSFPGAPDGYISGEAAKLGESSRNAET